MSNRPPRMLEDTDFPPYYQRLMDRYDLCVNPVRLSFVLEDDGIGIYSAYTPEFYPCLEKPGSRFVAVHVVIGEAEADLVHANLLLFDTVTREVELFDPQYSDLPAIHQAVQTWLTTVPGRWDWLRPLDFCSQQVEVRSQFHPANFGHCASWIFYYLETRLANPTMTRSKVLRQLRRMSPDELWHLINNFTYQVLL